MDNIGEFFAAMEGRPALWLLLITLYLPVAFVVINYKLSFIWSMLVVDGVALLLVGLAVFVMPSFIAIYAVNVAFASLLSLSFGNYLRFKLMVAQSVIPLRQYAKADHKLVHEITGFELDLSQAVAWKVSSGRYLANFHMTPLYAKGDKSKILAWLDGEHRAKALMQNMAPALTEKIKTPITFLDKHPAADEAPVVLIHTNRDGMARINLRMFSWLASLPLILGVCAYLFIK